MPTHHMHRSASLPPLWPPSQEALNVVSNISSRGLPRHDAIGFGKVIASPLAPTQTLTVVPPQVRALASALGARFSTRRLVLSLRTSPTKQPYHPLPLFQFSSQAARTPPQPISQAAPPLSTMKLNLGGQTGAVGQLLAKTLLSPPPAAPNLSVVTQAALPFACWGLTCLQLNAHYRQAPT